MLPYGKQSIIEADIEAVVEVLRSDFVTQGPMVPRFEEAVSQSCGNPHAVALSNGTAGLHVALRCMGVGHGDWVWTSPISFVASANAARYCGAKVDFVDVSPGTANLCPDQLELKLIQAEKDGVLPKVVVPVHFGGQPCEMERIAQLADTYGFRLVEDAAHALGASYQGEPVGSCRWSDATVFSFHPVKIITTGEGGMVTTADDALAQRMTEFRTHGITRDSERMQGESDGPWYYQQLELGYNYRMTDIQAALGASQMVRLKAFIERRGELANLYDERLSGLQSFCLPLERSREVTSAWHLYVIRLSGEASTKRREIFERMRELGIGVNVHYIPIHLQPDFAQYGFQRGMFPMAESYYQSCLTLPLFPLMEDADVDLVVSALQKCAAEFGGLKA